MCCLVKQGVFHLIRQGVGDGCLYLYFSIQRRVCVIDNPVIYAGNYVKLSERSLSICYDL